MLVYQQSLPKHLCFHDACALQMTKRRKQRSEAQKAAATRGREAQAAAASSHSTAASAAAAPATTSSSTVAPSAVAPADDLLPMAAPAAATQAAPDGAAAAEPRTGQKRKASSAPDVCLKLLARARYCALHACADAHGRATDCAAGPPAAAAAASAASAAPSEPSTSAAQQPASPVQPLSIYRCTRPTPAHGHARPAVDRTALCSPAMSK